MDFLDNLSINSFINLFINSFINPSADPPADLIFNVFVYSFLVNLAAIVFIDFKKFSSRFFFSRFFPALFKQENSLFTFI